MMTSADPTIAIDPDADVLESWFLSANPDARRPVRIDPDLVDRVPGAELILWEWTDYRLDIPGATGLWVNNEYQPCPFGERHFTLNFSNQLGLAKLTPVFNGTPGTPRYVEVLASKFKSHDASINFTDAITTELSARVSTLPFVVKASTARQIQRQMRQPNAFFVFHYLRHHGDELIRGLQIITADPHHRLGDIVEDVRIHQARRIDAEAIHSLLVGPRAGVPSVDSSATSLEKLQPLRVRQRNPLDTWNTPENRFVLAVCRRLSGILSALTGKRWYATDALDSDRERIDQLQRALRLLTRSDRFKQVTPSLSLPAFSRVMQNRAGYRELLMAWNGLMQVHRPVLADLDRAIDLRDIPTLYEYWLFFELASAIETRSGVAPTYPDVMDPYETQATLRATFAGLGDLETQRTFAGSNVYTRVQLRPDFVWTTPNGKQVVLDAKFAMTNVGELALDDSAPDSMATSRDIVKMHAYRDAIDGVDAALVLFPGSIGTFWSTDGGERPVRGISDILDDIIAGTLSGIGAVPMKPAMKGTLDE